MNHNLHLHVEDMKGKLRTLRILVLVDLLLGIKRVNSQQVTGTGLGVKVQPDYRTNTFLI